MADQKNHRKKTETETKHQALSEITNIQNKRTKV